MATTSQTWVRAGVMQRHNQLNLDHTDDIRFHSSLRYRHSCDTVPDMEIGEEEKKEKEKKVRYGVDASS